MILRRFRPVLVIMLCLLAGGLSGCGGDAWSKISVGTTSREAALRAMGDKTIETTGGLTLEEVSGWPTAIEVTHVEVEQGAVRWKLNYRGAVTHLIISQVVSTDINYEGPLPDAVARALRLPEAMTDGEFIGQLVQFIQGRIDVSAPENWTDLEQVRHDKYRSRFLGLMNVTMASLSGQGRLVRDDFKASVSGASPGSLKLEYTGGGVYRVEIRGSATLGPVPVL